MAADVAADGRMRARLVMGLQAAQVITVDSDTYIRATPCPPGRLIAAPTCRCWRTAG